MLNSRSNNYRISICTTDGSFRLISCHQTSLYEKLLEKDGSVSIRHKNMQVLATETFTYIQGLSRYNNLND